MRTMALSGEPREKTAGWAEAHPHKIAPTRKVDEFTRLRNGKRHWAEHDSPVAGGNERSHAGNHARGGCSESRRRKGQRVSSGMSWNWVDTLHLFNPLPSESTFRVTLEVSKRARPKHLTGFLL